MTPARAPAQRIRTFFIHPPIPLRQLDWQATFTSYESGDPIGRGMSEAEAIADLIEASPPEAPEASP